MKLLLVLALIVTASAHTSEDEIDASASEVVQGIHDLIDITMGIQLFELASIYTFFPIEDEFFEVMEYLQEMNVNFFTVSNLRNSTLSEVRAIKELFYTHGKDISIFVEVLAETMHLVQAKEKDVDKLKINFRTIVKRATGLVSDLMAIIERIERHSASFQYKIEKAVQIAKVDPVIVKKVTDNVVLITNSYSESYEELYVILQKAHENFDRMLPALRAYISAK